jgi:hypothetical protein
MASKVKQSTGKKTVPATRHVPWLWIGMAGAIILVAGIVFWQWYTKEAFKLTAGDKDLVVLLRNDKLARYRVQYTGRHPVNINSLQVMLEGQILHIDVEKVVLVYDGKETSLASDGTLPADAQIVLAPGGIFEVQVTYRGQTLGRNYMYGFRINYASRNGQQTYELVSNFDYAIIVE